MNTIKIYYDVNGNVSSLVKDFPLYQGQYQNKLINVIIPTALLQASFTQFTYDVATGTITGGTAVIMACQTPTEAGTKYISTNKYLRYVKTYTLNNIEVALFERLLPKEFCYYAGNMTLLINVMNVNSETGYITELVPTQQAILEVLPSGSLLDNDATVEATAIAELEADMTTLSQKMALKQDITPTAPSPLLTTDATTIVGAINEVDAHTDTASTNITTITQNVSSLDSRVGTLENYLSTGEDFIGQMTGTAFPTNAELDAYVLAQTSRTSKTGDTIIFILVIEDDTDKNYKYIKSPSGWEYYEIPATEKATNVTIGILRGSYTGSNTKTTEVQISVVNGVIDEVYAYDTTTSQYRNLGQWLQSVSVGYSNIMSGAVTVAKATTATNDGVGNNITSTYQTKNDGATKLWVRDYALSKIFNNLYYISSSGLIDTVPTTPADEKQFTLSFTTSDTAYVDKTMFTVDMTVGFDANISFKNTYSSILKIGSSNFISDTTTFKITTFYWDSTTSTWVPLCVDLKEITVDSAIETLSFGNNFNLLSPAVEVSLVSGVSKIRQVLEIQVSSTATAVSYYLLCGSTYQSTFNLAVAGETITLTSGQIGQLPYVKATYNGTAFLSGQSAALLNDFIYNLILETPTAYDTVGGASYVGDSTLAIITYGDAINITALPEVKELPFDFGYIRTLPYVTVDGNNVRTLLTRYQDGSLIIISQNIYNKIAYQINNALSGAISPSKIEMTGGDISTDQVISGDVIQTIGGADLDLTSQKATQNATAITALQTRATTIESDVTALKIVVVTDTTAGDKIANPLNNYDYRFGSLSGITSLTINAFGGTLATNTDVTFSVSFLSGTTATTITNTLGVLFTGDATSGLVFTPLASKQYDIVIWYDMIGWQGVVRES